MHLNNRDSAQPRPSCEDGVTSQPCLIRPSQHPGSKARVAPHSRQERSAHTATWATWAPSPGPVFFLLHVPAGKMVSVTPF